MEINRLKVRITIYKNVVSVDAIGNHKNVLEKYYTCYAEAHTKSANETAEAGLVVDDSKADFTLRYCKKAAAITSTGFQVKFQAEVYDILGVDPMNYNHQNIKLHCKKARR